ncbi:Endonuclease/exonuclease/phosphatase [Apiospora kogelbergensis]|uniref:Endonuclease/exonuclease/phosphatase n=1 Tax=Apiospora kogelbergensis TaxID=1337665 RepID=UPI00312D4194
MTSLDTFYLTFNAAKNHISVPAFANHLLRAFGQNATHLPELVVLRWLPISAAFIGSYLLNPFFERYESALNIAAANFVDGGDQALRPSERPYTLVRTRNVGMTGIMLFARDPAALANIQAAEVGFGAGDMANKGAVGLRMLYTKGEKETELTFVSTHLAAMEWNLERRNRNWESIVSGLVFADPKTIVNRDRPARIEREPTSGDSEPLLFHPETERGLHNVSIYKPGGPPTAPPSDAVFPVIDDSTSEDYYPRFLALDQLTAEKGAGRTLHGLSEAKINFPPTYKYNVLPKADSGPELRDDDGEEEVKWKFAKHRWPGWCDRVLWLDIPDWVKGVGASKKRPEMEVTAYDCLPVVRSSDHRGVFLRVQVPVLSPDELKPPAHLVEATLRDHGANAAELVDPRIRLPKAIDVDSWEHRASVKKWESLVGWSMFVSQSKQGIMVFTTAFIVALGLWWYRSL